MNQSGHITQEEWKHFAKDEMNTEEQMLLYEHVARCTYCAECMADEIAKVPVLPPKYLTEEILERSRKVDIQASVTMHKTSQKVQLFWYSVQIGFAVVASICLLLIGSSVQKESIEAPASSGMQFNAVTDFVNNSGKVFTDGLGRVGDSFLTVTFKEDKK